MASKKTTQKTATAATPSNENKVGVKGKAQAQSPVPAPVQAPAQVVEAVAAPVEKKEKSGKTKLTEKAQLTLNVNAVRTWLKKYYEQNGIDVPIFRGIHVALTAVCEVLCTEIINATVKQLQKSQSGLYEITRPAIRYAVLLDGDLEHLLSPALNAFDKTMTFSDHFCIPQKEMLKFIESDMGKNINLDVTAYNLLSYLLSKVMVDFARASHVCMTYADKGSLDFKVIRYVVKLKCTGSLENNLTRHIEDTEKLFVPEKEEQPSPVEAAPADKPAEKPVVQAKTQQKKLDPQPVVDDSVEEQVDAESTEEQEEQEEHVAAVEEPVKEAEKPVPAPATTTKKVVIRKAK